MNTPRIFNKSEYFLLLFFIFTAFVSLFSEIYSYDVWWHVVIGSDILKNFSVPSIDIYTLAGYGRPYFDSHWLFQVLLAFVHKPFGMLGVQLFMVFVWGVTLFFTCRSCMRSFIRLELCLLILFFVIIACSERFIVRPEIFTFLFIALYYWLLNKELPVTGTAVLFFIFQIIWTNSHGLFVIGPFMAGCYWISATAKRLTGQKDHLLKSATIYLIAVAAGSLVSPYGITPWKYSLLLAHEVGPGAPNVLQHLGELSPTFGIASRTGIAFWAYVILIAGSFVSTGYAVLKKTLSRYANILIVFGLLLASFTGRRNMALFAIVAGPFIANNLEGLTFPRYITTALRSLCIGMFLCWLFFLFSGRYYNFMSFSSRVGPGVTPSFFPHKLPGYLEQIGFAGNVFNSNYLGGFYLYHSYPKRLPLTDGRWEIYDKKELDSINSTRNNPESFASLVKKYKIEGLLLQHTSNEAKAILPWIRQSGKWKLAYLDAAASFWVPVTMKLPFVSIINPVQLLHSSRKLRVEDLISLGNFYKMTSMLNQYIPLLKELVARGWRSEQTKLELGRTLIKAGRLAEAEKIFRNLLSDFPQNLDALNELAYLAFIRGDIDTAKLLLRKVLSFDKNNAAAKNNLRMLNVKMRQKGEQNR